MELLYKNIIGTAVFEDDFPRPLTSVKDLILDPENAKVIAIVSDVNRNLIISPIDIVSWKNVIKINSGDAIIDGNEVLRVEAIQKKGIKFIGNNVETVDGKKLGNVVDLSINVNTFDLKRLYVSKTFLGLIRIESRIIPVSNIIEVLADKIIVKSDLEEIKEFESSNIKIKDLAVG